MRLLFSALTVLVVEQLALADLKKEALVHENGADRDTRILIQDNYYTLVSKLEHQETEIAALKTQQTNKQTELDQVKSDVANLKAEGVSKQTELDQLNTEVANLKAQETQLKADVSALRTSQVTKPHRVAFKAHLAKPMSPAQNQLIVFDDVRFNVGQAYHHGTFIAPYNGTYLFSVAMCSNTGHFIVVDLLKNGNMIGQVLAGDTNYGDCASETTVTELSAGDDVIVQHRGTVGDYIFGNQDMHSSFTGVLLY